MHPIQKKLYELLSEHDISNLTLRQIAESVDEKHPQKIKHHIEQLKKKGFIRQEGRSFIRVDKYENVDNFLISIPIMGAANCGEATMLTSEHPEGYLQVSRSLIKMHNVTNLFVIRAKGNSLNKASINGRNIDSGDYVLISKEQIYEYNNKYVLSVIDGMANIKKYQRTSDFIILLSESTEDHHPIYIHPEDEDELNINGVVIDVIKNV